MSKKRVHFETNDEEDEEEPSDGEQKAIPFKKKFHHSLDSDEEDEEANLQKYNYLDPAEFDGEEEGLARTEGDIKITAFNMREEMEEGHFDKEGTFIFKKNVEEADHWVQNLDSIQVADISKIKKFQQQQGDDDDKAEIDIVTNYKKMLSLMQKGETIKSAIQRIGSCIKELRTKNKKAKSDQIIAEIKLETSKLDKLTSIADQILLDDDVNIYEKTYEQLAFVVNEKTTDSGK